MDPFEKLRVSGWVWAGWPGKFEYNERSLKRAIQCPSESVNVIHLGAILVYSVLRPNYSKFMLIE